MQHHLSMRPLRHRLWTLGVLAGLAAVAGCADPDTASDERGGWDHNSGNYNGNGGSFGSINGLVGTPAWGATGPGTLTNATSYGIQYDPAVTSTCATATAGVTAVRFLSSSGDLSAAIGPDVELERTGGGRARLAMGEAVVFPGHVFDGYLGRADVMFRVRRVDTLTFRDALWYAWPVFALESCVDGDPPGRFRHHGFVSWAPMVRLPELPGDATEFRTDIVAPVTTIPRAEYRGNPNVPSAVATQTGALWFKFAFYASLPVALHGESALDLGSAGGAVVPNAEFLWRGALALGNASWVSLPTDPQAHRFLSFFTKDGTSISMFAIARGDGAADAIHLPAAWAGVEVDRLALTEAERSAPGALDSVQAVVAGAGEIMAADGTHLGSGGSRYRVGLYLGNSTNRNRYSFHAQWRANVARMNISGLGAGVIASQVALESALSSSGGPVAWAVACQAPAVGVPFERPTHVLAIPLDAPVQPPVGMDAGPDATPDGPSGMDARPDAAPDAGIDAPDAMPDAGVDALPDAGADALADAGADALPDAGDDATADATEDALPPPDGPMPCFAPCADAG